MRPQDADFHAQSVDAALRLVVLAPAAQIAPEAVHGDPQRLPGGQVVVAQGQRAHVEVRVHVLARVAERGGRVAAPAGTADDAVSVVPGPRVFAEVGPAIFALLGSVVPVDVAVVDGEREAFAVADDGEEAVAGVVRHWFSQSTGLRGWSARRWSGGRRVSHMRL